MAAVAVAAVAAVAVPPVMPEAEAITSTSASAVSSSEGNIVDEGAGGDGTAASPGSRSSGTGGRGGGGTGGHHSYKGPSPDSDLDELVQPPECDTDEPLRITYMIENQCTSNEPSEENTAKMLLLVRNAARAHPMMVLKKTWPDLVLGHLASKSVMVRACAAAALAALAGHREGRHGLHAADLTHPATVTILRLLRSGQREGTVEALDMQHAAAALANLAASTTCKEDIVAEGAVLLLVDVLRSLASDLQAGPLARGKAGGGPAVLKRMAAHCINALLNLAGVAQCRQQLQDARAGPLVLDIVVGASKGADEGGLLVARSRLLLAALGIQHIIAGASAASASRPGTVMSSARPGTGHSMATSPRSPTAHVNALGGVSFAARTGGSGSPTSRAASFAARATSPSRAASMAARAASPGPAGGGGSPGGQQPGSPGTGLDSRTPRSPSMKSTFGAVARMSFRTSPSRNRSRGRDGFGGFDDGSEGLMDHLTIEGPDINGPNGVPEDLGPALRKIIDREDNRSRRRRGSEETPAGDGDEHNDEEGKRPLHLSLSLAARALTHQSSKPSTPRALGAAAGSASQSPRSPAFAPSTPPSASQSGAAPSGPCSSAGDA